jgi:hypothetical protein
MRTCDQNEWWSLRLGEVIIDKYAVVFGYPVNFDGTSDYNMYVRVYQLSNDELIVGISLKNLVPDETINYISRNIFTDKQKIPSKLLNEINATAKKFEKLKAFA